MLSKKDKIEIVRLYTEEKISVTKIKQIMNRTWYTIRNVLAKNNIEIRNRGNFKPLDDNEKNKIIQLYTKEQMSIENIRKVMKRKYKTVRNVLIDNGFETGYRRTHIGGANKIERIGLRNNIINNIITRNKSYCTDFSNFENGDKISILNKSLKHLMGNLRQRDKQCMKHIVELFGDSGYIELFFNHFYNNKQFNILYSNWLNNERDKQLTPSLDHKIPVSKNGTDELQNLHFITRFENYTKKNMTWKEWSSFKQKYNFTSDLFIESILKNHQDKETKGKIL